MTDEQFGARLARLEAELSFVKEGLAPLRGRDDTLDQMLRAQAKEFTAALEAQSKQFAAAMERQTAQFVAKSEWDFWRPLLTAALMAIIGLGWTQLVGHR